jgi:DmsE family decaheme c-type cytochrome
MSIKNLVTGLFAGITLLICANAWAADDSAAEPPVYAPKGEQTCMKCHDQPPVTDILKTPHAVKADSRTPFGQHGCESCHGASPEHMKSAARVKEGELPVAPAVLFTGPRASPVAARNAVCLTCHEEGMRMNWEGSQHEASNVACTSCHTIHIEKDAALVKATQPEKCFTCHARQRAESFEYSHHPIREGKVVCADCHNPHGGPGPKMLQEFTVNDTCFTCHADKRGPFLWEHEPVRDDCSNCHTPHGSTQARLLKQRPPFLCSNCHQEGTHQSAVFSGNVTPGLGGGIGATPTQSAVNPRMLDRGCVNCHSQIHGSNSQGGAFFNR